MCESARLAVTVSVGKKVEDISFVDTAPENICNFAPRFSLQGTPAGGVFSSEQGIVTNGFNTFFDPSLTQPGTHTVYYTITDKGCASVASKTYTVLPVPQITFSDASRTVCIEETIDINRWIELIPSLTYKFYTDQNATAEIATPQSHKFTQLGATTFYVQALDSASGCTTSVETIKITITNEIQTNPIFRISNNNN